MATAWDDYSGVALVAAADKLFEPNWLDSDWQRYEDYYDGREVTLAKDVYFPRRTRETTERYNERPKLSFPLCRSIANLHARALIREKLITAIDHGPTQKEWDAIAAHNNMDAFARLVAVVSGVYGCAIVVPRKHDDATADKQLEAECYSPRKARPIYNSGLTGGSVRRLEGVVIRTVYDMTTGIILPWPAPTASANYMVRTEYISASQWRVFLNDAPAPTGPRGQKWQPRDDGSNPLAPVIPAVLFNNVETHEGFLGQSDLRVTVYDNQVVNELWSDVVYASRMYVPLLCVISDNETVQTSFKAGIGAGLGLNKGDDAKYAAPPDALIEKMLEPMRVALELLYSNAHAPAIAVGLGHLFGKEANVSGVSKEIEYRPTLEYRNGKWPAFERGWKEFASLLLRIAAADKPFGQGKSTLEPDATITVTCEGELIPETEMERIERESALVLNKLKTLLSAMRDANRWSDEQAAREFDGLLAEQKRTMLGLTAADVTAILTNAAKIKRTPEETQALTDKVFSPAPVAPSDEAAADEKTDGSPEEVAAANAAA